jgi:undecaprenyl diphosphate synthase
MNLTLPDGTKVPDHIALILDGNRRWARARGLQPWEGHKAGYEAVVKLAHASRKLGVNTFTVWAFSTENWDRPGKEIEAILNLLRRAIINEEPEFHKEQVRFVHLGRKDRFPADIAKGLTHLEEVTRKYDKNVFNVALDYGGRDEIVRAVNKAIKDGVTEVDEKSFATYLDTAGQPYPYVDLFIRTSGEQRTSGLLPWQMTYAEMFWEVDHLPDFSPEKLREAILDFSRRRRRFGGDDAVEHMKFDPRVMARLEIEWRKELASGGSDVRFRDRIVKYVMNQYGLSKVLAKTAGISLAKALIYRQEEEWDKAKEALKGLYEVVKKNLGLAMEPELVANIEVDMWRKKTGETGLRALLAEKFRFSEFQASKSAHLGHLASVEADKGNWEQAKSYMEKYYQALKERVA